MYYINNDFIVLVRSKDTPDVEYMLRYCIVSSVIYGMSTI